MPLLTELRQNNSKRILCALSFPISGTAGSGQEGVGFFSREGSIFFSAR